MTDRNDGGPAFPVSGEFRVIREQSERDAAFMCGMSLRDWFAGQVDLQDYDEACICAVVRGSSDIEDYPREEARIRYKKADAMLAERGRREESST